MIKQQIETIFKNYFHLSETVIESASGEKFQNTTIWLSFKNSSSE